MVGDAANAADAVEIVARMRPDALLLQLKMPDGGAVESLLRVAEKSPATGGDCRMRLGGCVASE